MKRQSPRRILRREVRILLGQEARNRSYQQTRTHPDEAAAGRTFAAARQRLFAVEGWSGLPGLTATFTHFDAAGQRKRGQPPAVGDYLFIDLPGPDPGNWVRVTAVEEGATWAEFVARPSAAPSQPTGPIAHFFGSDARTIFRVERRGTEVRALEIGENERINNRGPAAGRRALLNTLMAEIGWLFLQPHQWKTLTRYLVEGKIE
jgi:hypothetical protein